MKKINWTRYITIFIILAAIVWTGFYMINNRRNSDIFSESVTKNTEVESILKLDMVNYYPATPREVVRTYARLQKAFFNEAYNEENFTKMVKLMREMFDDELLEANPYDKHLTAIHDEIAVAKGKKRTVSSYKAQKERDTEYWTKDGKEYASIVIYFSVRSNDGFESTYEKFLLRKDANKNWKILGWDLTDPVTIID